MAQVTFDGPNKLIIVNVGVTTLSVKTDIYSAWKDWVAAGNAQYEPAVRGIGGDPIGGGQFAGDIYFLMNGWKLYVDHACDLTGVLYSEDQSNPIVTPANTFAVRSFASNLVLAQATGTAALTTEEHDRLFGTAEKPDVAAVGDLVVAMS